MDPGPQAVVTDEVRVPFPITINPVTPNVGMLLPDVANDLVPEALDAEGPGTVGQDSPKVKLILNGGDLQDTAMLIAAEARSVGGINITPA